MQIPTLILIFLAFILTFVFVYFQYFYKEKKNSSTSILSVLRFISFFLLFILLINPKIERKVMVNIKPKLLLAIDNSSSIALSKNDSLVRYLIDKLGKDEKIKNKFDLEYYSFGSELISSSEFYFDKKQTNIYKAIEGLNSLSVNSIAPIILISDGNQTYGRDYKYYPSKQEIYSVMIGDTLQFSDLEITMVNVNSYSYLENNFPVEVFIKYKGIESIQTNFTILNKDNEEIYMQKLEFSNENKSAQLKFKLPSNKVGKHLYKAYIKPFNKEVNILNNKKSFGVEVIDEQAKIALIYNFLHPDIGMLKKSVESNKQHVISLIDVNSISFNSSDYDAFILYQPDKKFKNVFEEIQESKKNIFIITGTQTDWDFLNTIQEVFKNNVIDKTEEFFPDFNVNFGNFLIEDIGFSDLPPLEGLFGEIEFTIPVVSILTQSIEGIKTENPLLVVYSDRNNRGAVLFGENIWKWRSLSFQAEHSFKIFDKFFNSIIQFLAISKKSNNLELIYNSIYYSDEPVKIKAKSYDANFNFNVNSDLELILNGHDKIPFYINGSSFEVNLNDLDSGNYNFTVIDKLNNKNKSGVFTVVDYSIEQEVLSANIIDLKKLSQNSKGLSYYPDQLDKLIDHILNEPNIISFQKEQIKKQSLIDWKWLLGIIILSLGSEWFIRKFRGLV